MIPVVDTDDSILTHKKREAVLPEDIYRVSSLWITDSKGKILLAQRAFSKSNDPGKWGPAVAGTVEQGETYESNILKEAEEELGLQGVQLEKGRKELHEGEHRFFCQEFSTVVDQQEGDFSINLEEVAAIKWWVEAELRKAVFENPDAFLPMIQKFCSTTQ